MHFIEMCVLLKKLVKNLSETKICIVYLATLFLLVYIVNDLTLSTNTCPSMIVINLILNKIDVFSWP